MNFVKILGSESFKEGNFFYDLEKKDYFNKEAYKKLIINIRKYKESIKNNDFIHKSIISNFFSIMPKPEIIELAYKTQGLRIKGIKNLDELYDYLEDLNIEIMQLMSIEN